MARSRSKSSATIFPRVRGDAERSYEREVMRIAINKGENARGRESNPNNGEDEDENSEEAEAQLRKKHKDIFVQVVNLKDELREKYISIRREHFQ